MKWILIISNSEGPVNYSVIFFFFFFFFGGGGGGDELLDQQNIQTDYDSQL